MELIFIVFIALIIIATVWRIKNPDRAVDGLWIGLLWLLFIICFSRTLEIFNLEDNNENWIVFLVSLYTYIILFRSEMCKKSWWTDKKKL